MVQWRVALGRTLLSSPLCELSVTSPLSGWHHSRHPSLALCTLPPSLQGPLLKCKFRSFFSLLKHAFDALHDRKGEISKVCVYMCVFIYMYVQLCLLLIFTDFKECPDGAGRYSASVQYSVFPFIGLVVDVLYIPSMYMYMYIVHCTMKSVAVSCLLFAHSSQQNSVEVADCTWLDSRSDWLDLILSALTYLSAEVGAVSSFDPLPFFFPVVEFRDRIDHWKWMG